MANESTPRPTSTEDQEKLPFDPRTILTGLLMRWRILAAFAAAAGILGIAGAMLLGHKTYQAQTVLLYRPDADNRMGDPTATVQTQVNMVKLQSNLEEVRRRMQLSESLEDLDSQLQVRTQPNTALLLIDAEWNSPDEATRIANTLRDVFLENQQRVRQRNASVQIKDIEERLGIIRKELEAADSRLQEFSGKHGVVDIDKETQQDLAELSSTELLYAQAQADKKSIDTQAANADRILDDLGKRSGGAPAEAPNELNVRYQRLRDAIHEDQSIRSNGSQLDLRKLEMDRSKQLFEQGLIAKAEYDKAVLAYDIEKQIAQDTDQVKKWRAQIAQLDKGIVPSGSASTGALQKAFQLELDQIAANEKVKQLEQARDRIRAKVDSLPVLQRDYVKLSRDVTAKDLEKKDLEEKLSRAQRIQQSRSTEFDTIADATPPAVALKSNRKLWFAGITLLGCLMGLGVVLGLELKDNTVRSPSEAALKFSLPVLGALPRMSGDFASNESLRTLALHLRREVEREGARILFASAKPGEGVTTIVNNLAECLARQDETVLVFETDIRHARGKAARATAGLGDYLLSKTTAGDFVPQPEASPGVSRIPLSDTQVTPDLLGTHRMRDLLHQCSKKFTAVLLVGTPVLQSIDAEVLAPWADAIVLVVQASATTTPAIRKAIERLSGTGTPIAGIILNQVHPVYLDTV
jgi:uncharacterized protein involved in exopolysaccharide biosynthesis/Mrp family chromosome partitioning ATPase